MDKTRYQSSAAEKWFGKANQYEPKPGTDYEWVWEYAKFRLAWATERVQHIEDKALEFLKLILAFGAAGWAVLTVVLHVKLNEISNLPKWLGIVSFAVFLASVGFALWLTFRRNDCFQLPRMQRSAVPIPTERVPKGWRSSPKRFHLPQSTKRMWPPARLSNFGWQPSSYLWLSFFFCALLS